jgi:hypothetical protein
MNLQGLKASFEQPFSSDVKVGPPEKNIPIQYIWAARIRGRTRFHISQG